MLDRTFRPYEPDQLLLLPPSLGEWLPMDHLAYFVSDVVTELNLTAIFITYGGVIRGRRPMIQQTGDTTESVYAILRMMELTEAQYRQIESCLPMPCGNVTFNNRQVLNAIMYVVEHGCKWHGLPKQSGNWHAIYTRMNRWSKSGVLDRVFTQLQQAQILRVKIEAVALDRTLG